MNNNLDIKEWLLLSLQTQIDELNKELDTAIKNLLIIPKCPKKLYKR